MYKKIVTLALFILGLVSLTSAQVVSSVVSNNDYRLGMRYSECRNSARMPDGTIVVSWESHDAFDREIYYSTYDVGLGTWSDRVQLSNISEDTRGPALVADDAGTIYAEWEEKQGGVYSVMFSKFDGVSWTAPVAVDTFSSSIGMGNIGVSPDGGTIVIGYLTAWAESADIFAAVSVDGGANWTTTNLTATLATPGLISQRYVIPSIAVTASGDAYMTWYDVPDDVGMPFWWAEVMMSTYDGTWSSPEIISLNESTANNWDGRGVIALDPDENLHLVYASNDTSYDFLPDGKPKAVVLYRKNVGGVWSDAVKIDDSIEPSAWEPSIGIGPNGAIYITYSQLDPAYPDVRNSYYVTSADGGANFSLPVKVSNNTYPSTENFPEISIGSVRDEITGVFSGGADITWIEYDTTTTNDFNIMHGVIPTITSGPNYFQTSIVSNNDYRLGMRYSECRNSARMPDGTIVVSWESHDAFDREIYYSTYDVGLGTWSDRVQLSNISEDTRGPALVADDAGTIYAEWEEKQGGVYSVMFSKFDGVSWTAPVAVDTFSSSIGMGNIGVSPDGGTIVIGYLTAWAESADIFAAVSVDGGANWTTTNLTATLATPGLISQRYVIPSIAVTASGDAYMTWYDVPDDVGMPFWWAEVMMSTYDGTWSSPEIISLNESTANNWDGRGVIALDPDENLHLVYASNDTSYDFLPDGKPKAVVLYRKNVGGVWSDAVKIDDSIEPSAWEPSIGIGPNGAIYITYSQLDPAYPDVRNSYYVTSADGGANFSLPVKVSNNTYPSTENFPEISIGSVRDEITGVFSGGADITWIEYDTTTTNDFNIMHGVIPTIIVTGIENPNPISKLPQSYLLSQNYPNPFNPSTTIKFSLPKLERITLSIYNIMGQRVRTLIDEIKTARDYKITWDGRDASGNTVASGVYFYQLQTSKTVLTKKMILIR